MYNVVIGKSRQNAKNKIKLHKLIIFKVKKISFQDMSGLW